MNLKEMSELSAELIIKYYDNDYMPFLEHMDDDALWYGPAEGQFLRGRERMIKTWKNEEHTLTFSLGNIQTAVTSAHPSFCDVVLTYVVITHYPDGHDLSVLQRLLLTWCERKVKDESGKTRKLHRILCCHIANLHRKSEDDVIYAKEAHPVLIGTQSMPHRSDFIHFHSSDKSEYYFHSDTVTYIESDSLKKHCIIHAKTGDVTVQAGIGDIERRFPGLFLRCHQSYLVNPNYIREMRRFSVTLADGTELPVPEKKYTSFRAEVAKALKSAHRDT
ncbi:MAG: LytTR family transcriptional regulator DNA-binding domain-containing protein [Clostridia bacterium]|nr:LytTR family transcriptional regulator DNA-binding domain-containing protein [Clostridia bacterium]